MAAPQANAQIFWAGAGSNPATAGGGTWNTSNTQWSSTFPAYTSTSFSNGSNVQFAGTGGGSVLVQAPITVGNLTFAPGAGGFDFANSTLTFNTSGTGITNSSSNTQIFTNDVVFNSNTSAGNNLEFQGVTTFQGSGATAGSGSFLNIGDMTFANGSTFGTATITNDNNLFVTGSVTASSATLVNGGSLDISGATGGLTIGTLNNDSNTLAGGIDVGLQTLTVGNFSLATGAGLNSLSFQLQTPSSTSDGTIVVTSSFTGSGTGETEIFLEGISTPGTPGVPFVLIDWSSATASGVALDDFVISPATLAAAGLSSYRLAIDGSQLVLVPEPASFAMPLAAVLGLASLRRRKAKATA